MMGSEARKIAKVLNLNGGEIVGRTRLQKTLYFLETQGVGFGFDFNYHHYGPYSEDLTIAVDDAVALGYVTQEKRSGSQMQPYSVFRSLSSEEPVDVQHDSRRVAILGVLAGFDAITLELAATADFLQHAGFDDRAWKETALRKSTKATGERIDKAKKLLEKISEVPV